jgi:two-component system, NarL family, nitrate/nitrite response regulator NarL
MLSGRLRVLIVDDHDLFRTGLRALLEEEGFDVLDSAGGAAGIRRARSFEPQVVVMDMNMPGMSGVEATPLMLEVVPEASILMLTIANDKDEVLDAVRAGASGYLLKDAELSEIVAGVRAAAAGRSAIAAEVAGHLLASVRAHHAGTASAPPPEGPLLSCRESEVLTLVTEGCNNAEIASRLYMSPSTVKNHVSRLLEKLGVDNRVQAATFAARRGLHRPELPVSRNARERASARILHA